MPCRAGGSGVVDRLVGVVGPPSFNVVGGDAYFSEINWSSKRLQWIKPGAVIEVEARSRHRARGQAGHRQQRPAVRDDVITRDRPSCGNDSSVDRLLAVYRVLQVRATITLSRPTAAPKAVPPANAAFARLGSAV